MKSSSERLYDDVRRGVERPGPSVVRGTAAGSVVRGSAVRPNACQKPSLAGERVSGRQTRWVRVEPRQRRRPHPFDHGEVDHDRMAPQGAASGRGAPAPQLASSRTGWHGLVVEPAAEPAELEGCGGEVDGLKLLGPHVLHESFSSATTKPFGRSMSGGHVRGVGPPTSRGQ